MPIEYKSGDMFDEPAEAIVNTVNCVGVMGKGVALEFKRRWPENYKIYKKACDDKALRPGAVLVFENMDLIAPDRHRYLFNFSTKDNWRSKSKIEYIEEGLDDLIREIRDRDIASVAMPPLGCGNGGLDWNDVRPILERRLAELPNVRFVLFTPELGVAPEHASIPDTMTIERATMLVAFAELEQYFGGTLTRLTAQKLTYFLQILGVDFGLKFSKQEFGPYSDTLHKAFKTMEAKRFIRGYTGEDRKVDVPPAAYAVADEFLKKHDVDVSGIAKRLSLLIEGYESPYGMELLASIHYLWDTEGISSQCEIIEALKNWNDHKREAFEEAAVKMAIERLKEDQFIH